MPERDPAAPPVGEVPDALFERARALITRLEGTSVRRLRLQAGDMTLEIERAVAPAGAAPPVALPAVEAARDGAAAASDHGHTVNAPLVGAFYRAPKPGDPPFVEVGDVVVPGQPVCIVEAMKVMNQVVADQPGRVAEILVANGEYVEFDQALMRLEPVDAEEAP